MLVVNQLNGFGAGRIGRVNAFRICQQLGLTGGLKLCLDAGDAASLPSSPTKWLDLSGNGYDFNLGADGTHPGTDEPTANGTPGNLSSSEYLSSDGGDFLTYDSPNETWMEDIHKDNAAFTFMVWAYVADQTISHPFCGTSDAASGGGRTGFRWFGVNTGNSNPRINIVNAGAVVLVQSSNLTPNNAAWNCFGISLNEATGAGGVIHFVNGSTDTDDSTYSSPATGAASFTMKIGNSGNGTLIWPNGSRMAEFFAWNRALSAAEMKALYNATRSRFAV